MYDVSQGFLYLFSFLGGILAVYEIYVIFRRTYVKVTWKNIENNVLSLIHKLKERQYKPDLIVGIGRSGAIIASMISGNMDIRPLIVIDVIYRWDNGVRTMEIISPLKKKFFQGKKILVVMLETFSGQTIKELKAHFEKLKPNEVKTFNEVKTLVVFKGKQCPFTPDFYAKLANAEMPVPWRLTFDYKRWSKPP